MHTCDKSKLIRISKTVLICGLVLYLGYIIFFSDSNCRSSFRLKWAPFNSLSNVAQSKRATNILHLLFGLLGSEKACHHRKSYIESWWRPNVTKGYLLPWSSNSPPYKIYDDVPKLVSETKHVDATVLRLVHGIMEVYREEHEGVRWLVMGDDDSIIFLDNMVEILAQYDHTKYYYFGGHSEFILSNYWYSFNQGFGGAGFILSYPLAKALAKDMVNCLKRYNYMNAADKTTMTCIADIGVHLSPLQAIHQIHLGGDLSGFLSSYPKSLLMSLHHFDMVDPIFPSLNRAQSVFHLENAAQYDQSRACYNKSYVITGLKAGHFQFLGDTPLIFMRKLCQEVGYKDQ
ncbi:beta-1,3-glucosyltransferase-like [Capsicum annuum]